MTILKNYHQFDGRHRDTGPIRNVLAYQGMPAPHTGQPLSEALLLGISGGITVGYFIFEYKGYLPHVALLTRNTFDPLESIFERLVIPRDVLQTSKPEIGHKNLIEALESGHPALVWVDIFSLPHKLLGRADQMWAMLPVVVYGIEGETVYLADGSNQPITVPLDVFTAARGRVKDDKYRVMLLEPPDMDKLPAAVQKGIWQCISLFTDAPPKGARDNFGFAALQHWADMLVNTRNKRSWERTFPPGSPLYNALVGDIAQPGVYDWIVLWGGADGAERGLYADFLDEAAAILNKPALKSVGEQFRTSAAAWNALAMALLPDDIAPLKEARELRLRKHNLYIEDAMASLEERRAINQRLIELKEAAATDFPLNAAQTAAFRENLREHVLRILDLEREAITNLQSAMT